MRAHAGLVTALVVLLLLVTPAASGAPAPLSVRAPVDGRVLRFFDPPGQPWDAGHRGVKLAAATGEAVRGVLDGTVTFSGQVARAGWVTVDHGGGLETTYGVLGARAVTRGQRVHAGDTLGWVADGPQHLHWGARIDGEYVDPLLLLDRWQVRLVPVEHRGGPG